MNNATNYDARTARANFEQSANWQAFKLEFAKNFYALKPEQADYAGYFDIAMKSSSYMPCMIEAINALEESNKKISVKELSRFYWNIKNAKYEQIISQSDCSICNNNRIVHNVEADIQGAVTLLDPASPQPCTAYATVAPCRCVGGEAVHADKRFVAPRDEHNRLLVGCEHISQRMFIDDCRNLLKQSERGI